jgi:hypothetical protein
MSTKTYDRRINIYINGKEVENNVKSIRNEMFKLINVQKNMTVGSAEYVQKGKEIRHLKKILDEHNQSLKTTGGMWDKVKGLLPIASVTALAAKVVMLSKDLVNLSKRMEADGRRASIVFGESLSYVEKEADKLSKKMGVTSKEFIAMSAATADLLIPLDFTREQSAQMSVELQKLTGALDEWTGGSIGAAEVSNILTKAMLGENEQLKQLGIAIRKDSEEYRELVKIKMQAPGVTKAQAEAMATLELIMKKSADAQTAYNTEGNKLLRNQKAIGRAWRETKENIVEYFKESPAEKLKQEGEMVNKLTTELYNQAIPQERRLEIYNQLKTIAPDIVATLDDEMKATLATRDALIEYNKQLINKIILSQKDEKIEKEREDAASATQKRIEAENKVLAAMNNAAKRYGGSKKEQINEIMSSGMSVMDMVKALQKLNISIEQASTAGGGSMVYQGAGTSTDSVGALLAALQREEKANNKLFEIIDERQALADRLGVTTATVISGGGSPDLSGSGGSGGAPGTVYAAPEIPGLLDFITEAIKQDAETIPDILAKLISDQNSFIEEWVKNQEEFDFIDTDKLLQEGDDRRQRELDSEKSLLEQKAQLYVQYATAIGSVLGQAVSDGEMTAKEAAKQILIIALDALEKFAILAVAKATMGSLSTLDSIATFGASAVPRIAILTGLIKAAVGAAQGAVANMWTGGFTGPGGKYQPKGIVHGNEWVANSEMVDHPVTGPIIQSLEDVRTGRIPGFSQRGMTGGGSDGSADKLSPLYKDMIRSTNMNIKLLQVLLDGGVKNVFTYKDVQYLREGMDKLKSIEDDVSRG